MTREEAILKIEYIRDGNDFTPTDAQVKALDMAIEALQEPKTIIGIDIPYGNDKGLAAIFKGKDDKLILEEVKEIMSVVRCKDCRNRHSYSCPLEYYDFNEDDDYCSWGKKEIEE